MTSVMSGLAVCAASSAATRAIPVHPYEKRLHSRVLRAGLHCHHRRNVRLCGYAQTTVPPAADPGGARSPPWLLFSLSAGMPHGIPVLHSGSVVASREMVSDGRERVQASRTIVSIVYKWRATGLVVETSGDSSSEHATPRKPGATTHAVRDTEQAL